MESYASIKSPAVDRAKSSPGRRQAPELSEAQMTTIDANRAFVRQNMPEIEPLIRALYAEGLIDGWRAVKICTLNEREQ